MQGCLRKARGLIEKLMKMRAFKIFCQPVHETNDKAAAYYLIIDDPEDLGSIRNGLVNGHYKGVGSVNLRVLKVRTCSCITKTQCVHACLRVVMRHIIQST